ncbi:MAG: hypothetical protein JNM70_22810, partial [Anaerolineae bacterium]|nr:hypothetical protein [Anaerolineae bacterium]
MGVNVSRREAIEQRRRNWRIALVIVIVITIPFYCAGILLWGTAPVRGVATPTWTPPGAACPSSSSIRRCRSARPTTGSPRRRGCCSISSMAGT